MQKRIFAIDDDPFALQLIVAVLQAEGYDVLPFSDFEALLQAARQQLPDLVLTDVVMPKVTGFEVCRKIKDAFFPSRLLKNGLFSRERS